MIEEPEDRPLSETREPVMLLFVGIVILLLSFFVVMNHSASVEGKKADKVARGIVARFDAAGGLTSRFVSNVGDSLGEEPMIGRFGKLVATVFPFAEMKVVEPGRVLVIDLPLGHMWIEDKIAPTDSGRRLIAALAGRLSEPQARQLYGLEARLIAAPDMPRPLALARIAAFGDAMEDAGAPAVAVATTVDTGPASALRLVFSER